MSAEQYSVLIFGDEEHPEVKGVKSYASDDVHVIEDLKSLDKLHFKYEKKLQPLRKLPRKKRALFTNSKCFDFKKNKEVRVFNTICDATFENQDAARELSKEVDVMIVIGGKNSSNTKQLFSICLENCQDSYLIENKNELNSNWFQGKSLCGITAGASTPDWIIQEVVNEIQAV